MKRSSSPSTSIKSEMSVRRRRGNLPPPAVDLIDDETCLTPPRQPIPSVEPAAPKKTSQKPWYATTFTKEDLYSGYVKNYHNINCHFLKKECYFTIKLCSSQMCFTRNDSLAIFTMSQSVRDKITAEVETLCSLIKTGGEGAAEQRTSNIPTAGTVFFRLSPAASYYRKYKYPPPVKVDKSEIPHGRLFSGNVALMLKGVKVSLDSKIISPMITVVQVMMTEPPIAEPYAEAHLDRCIVEDVPEDGLVQTTLDMVAGDLDF